MQIITKHILRSLLQNKLRSILVIISITIASASFYVNLNIHSDLRENSQKLFQIETKGFDIMVKGDLVSNEPVLPEYEEILDFEYVQIPSAIGYFCHLEDFFEDCTGFEDNSVVVNQFNADSFGLSIGSMYDKYTLVKIDDSIPMLSNLDTDDIEAFVQKEKFNANVRLVKLANDNNLKEICERIKADNPSFEIKALYDSEKHSSIYHNIENILLVILFLVSASSVYIISSTTKLIIESEITDLACFRSCGASKKKVNAIMSAESSILGLFAGVVGVIIGEILRIILRTRLFDLQSGVIKTKYVVYSIIFSVALSLAVSIFLIIQSTKKSIRELLSAKQEKVSIYPWKSGILGIGLLCVSFILEWLNNSYSFTVLIIELLMTIVAFNMICSSLIRLVSFATSKFFKTKSPCLWLALKNNEGSTINRGNTILVSTVISLLIVIYTVTNSFSVFFDVYSDKYPYEIMIKNLSYNAKEYSDINEVEGISDVFFEFWKNSHNQTVNGIDTYLCFLASDGFTNGVTADSQVLNNLKKNEVIIDKLLAKKLKVKPGNLILVEGTYTFIGKVVGLCDSSIFNTKRNTIIMNHEFYNTTITTKPAVIGINLNSDRIGTIIGLSDYMNSKHDNNYKISDVKSYVDNEYNEAVNGIKLVSAVPVLITVLSVLGLTNNQLISFSRKKRLYAVLLSTSMSIKQITKMILCELLSTAFFGIITGMFMSLRLSHIIRDIVFVSITYIPLSYNLKSFILPIVTISAGMFLSSFFPIAHFKKMSTIKEIQYE